MQRIITLSVSIFLIVLLALACGKKEGSKDFDKLSFEEKMALLDANIKKNPSDAELYYQRAKLYYQVENTKDALFDIQKAIKLDKKEPKYYILAADTYFARGESTLAFDALNQATKYDKNNVEAYAKIAELSFLLRDYNRARENIDKVLELDKINAEAYFQRGMIYKEIGDTLNAIKDYRKAIEYKSDYEQVFEELANIFASKDDPIAIEYYQSTININPKNVDAMYNLGQFYQDHNAIQKALDLYQKILQIKPNYANAIYATGYINYVYKEDYDMALDCFEKTVMADSSYFEAYSMMSKIYAMQNKTEQANKSKSMADSLRNIYTQTH
ncbi:MAG: tetratricopeptide repeat protein [Bacteroidota bacterium]|nr:tetratricopeptide repeat protein [Bacteroidota bacterium]